MVRSTLALAAVLAVASTSLAGDLVTPGVAIGSDSGVDCRLVSGPITVGAGSSSDFGESIGGMIVYCRFVNTSKSKARAALTAYSLSGDGSTTVVASAQ
jgi:hypothetical protein